jgi:hypothetical protein
MIATLTSLQPPPSNVRSPSQRPNRLRHRMTVMSMPTIPRKTTPNQRTSRSQAKTMELGMLARILLCLYLSHQHFSSPRSSSGSSRLPLTMTFSILATSKFQPRITVVSVKGRCRLAARSLQTRTSNGNRTVMRMDRHWILMGPSRRKTRYVPADIYNIPY